MITVEEDGYKWIILQEEPLIRMRITKIEIEHDCPIDCD